MLGVQLGEKKEGKEDKDATETNHIRNFPIKEGTKEVNIPGMLGDKKENKIDSNKVADTAGERDNNDAYKEGNVEVDENVREVKRKEL